MAHTDADGHIDLSTHLEGASVVLCVADSGDGILPAQLKRIFDPLARVDPHRNRKAGGVGLGLAIVKAIAVAHHGSVRAHSTLCQGSRFEVLLPQSTTGRAGSGPARRRAGPRRAHKVPAATPTTHPWADYRSLPAVVDPGPGSYPCATSSPEHHWKAATLATGGVILMQVLQSREEDQSLVEVPLIVTMFLVMVWHGRRRLAADEPAAAQEAASSLTSKVGPGHPRTAPPPPVAR